ncbi:cytochrome p450 [Trifolium pratense]|uniref:Cytochrome p450 n=1 Tax=Trifolium pratense TaxID=57577 RepID=A0A2K3MPK9_TRIPR|nr:cytochrome p450 [Trifolium pratense]
MNNIWQQMLDSSFTVDNCAHQLLEGLMRAEPVTASGLMRAEPATASLSDTGLCVAECYVVGPGVAWTVGTGICIRDELGQFGLAKTEWITLLCGVEVGEALGEYMSLDIPKSMI